MNSLISVFVAERAKINTEPHKQKSLRKLIQRCFAYASNFQAAADKNTPLAITFPLLRIKLNTGLNIYSVLETQN
jgi:hypothetical protein